MLQNKFNCALQCARSCGTESKNILKNVWLSLKCYKIKQSECAKFGAFGSIGQVSTTIPVHFEPGAVLFGGAIGSTGRVSKTIPVHLETGAVLSGSDYYNVYIK
jgi:hypothetical protein